MKIFNTLSGQKEEFAPQGDTVGMYVCGVTPYSDSHVGHAMSYIIFDTIRRYIRFRGYKVKYVQNFTDIDDKIIARANNQGITVRELADHFIAEYFTDMDALNIERADIYPRATDEIPKIIEVIQGLVDKGHAYVTPDGVYFRVSSDAGYGKLSQQSLGSLLSGARIEVGVEKEHPLDFALWKASKPGEPKWESPWCEGRPGWHIECSAMSLKYIGDTLDIHGGGQDLIFPHHENEIAQSECFTGVVPFAKCWIHNGLVQFRAEKMSKSIGNLITIKEALHRYSADALRLFVLSSHYRSPLTYSEESIEAAEKGMQRLRQATREMVSAGNNKPLDSGPYHKRFIDAMDDDFNTSQAIASIFDLAREINRANSEGLDVQESQQTLLGLSKGLGFTLQEPQISVEVEPFVDLLVSLRTDLRNEKLWKMADRVRDSLVSLGIALEDSSQGTTWKYKK